MANELFAAVQDAEEALLGAVLISPDIIREVAAVVHPGDFLGGEKGRHSRIYRAMLVCQHPDQVTVAHKMHELGLLESGDCAYLVYLVSICPCWLDWPYYAAVVRDYAVQRNVPYLLKKGATGAAAKELARVKKFTGGIRL